MKSPKLIIPAFIQNWFRQKDWVMRDYQEDMFALLAENQSTLLVAPTGGGKTLASFLPVLADIHKEQVKGLHTLYISPLRALTEDIKRNVSIPIAEMNLDIQIEIRTGDTSSYQRQRQIKKPPHILLTTPESLFLLLSHAHAQELFSRLKYIIVDELHSFAYNKRGDLTSLALAQLQAYSPKCVRVGLSATVARPQLMAKWLASKSQKITVLRAQEGLVPIVHLLTKETIPYCGFKAKYAIEAIYELINQYKMSLIFVNTRANAEFLFHQLWLCNHLNHPIAIYHGSLSKEQRHKTEQLCIAGQLKAVVSTSALELGIDWGNIDAVIQVGAPHGISRLLQRIGRSNHQLDKPSCAYLVPTHCFDALECAAAQKAIFQGQKDEDEFYEGALDVAIQFIMNSACSQPIKELPLLKIINSAYPFRKVARETFSKLFQFAKDGGYTLQHYSQYHRLIESKPNWYVPSSDKVIRRHRQNIGTIIEYPRIKVKVLNKRKGRIVGEIEESFVQELVPGDTFLFAGENLEYIRLHDMMVEAKKVPHANPKLPIYSGGNMPMSTFMADGVRALIQDPTSWNHLPLKVQEWIKLQQKFSMLPNKNELLVEQFPYKRRNHLVIYTFEGLKNNRSLGVLITHRMETLKLKPLSFTVTEYGIAITTFKKIDASLIPDLFSPSILYQELELWLQESSMLKRVFRQIAIISGLTERQIAGTRKTMKQVTFSTDLIYEVLKRYEPEHILLKITEDEAKQRLLNFGRLSSLLERFHQHIQIKELQHSSPFSIPILSTFSLEKVTGEGEEELLSLAEIEANATQLIQEVKDCVVFK